jgi:L-serine dehydratase
VLPAIVYGLGEGGRKLPPEKIREGMLAAAAIGYLCKHNATLSAAEGGCQAEIGVASAMAAALVATAHDASPRVVENAAESALEHHLGMTCDPVAGSCRSRASSGARSARSRAGLPTPSPATKSHRAIASASTRTIIRHGAKSAKDMNSKYRGDQRGGLALCGDAPADVTEPAHGRLLTHIERHNPR